MGMTSLIALEEITLVFDSWVSFFPLPLVDHSTFVELLCSDYSGGADELDSLIIDNEKYPKLPGSPPLLRTLAYFQYS